MDVEVLVEVLGKAQELSPGADVGHRRLGRLLHHLAEFSGDGQLPLPREGDHLDVEEFTADLGPGEAGHEPHRVLLSHLAVLVARGAKVGSDLLGLHGAARLATFGDGEGYLAADCADLAL